LRWHYDRLDLHLHHSGADFTLPAPASANVSCAGGVHLKPPTVTDNCGNVITPSAPVITNTRACGGTTIYTYYLYQLRWNKPGLDFTLHDSGPSFTLPAPGASSVACITDAVMPTPPAVTDNCGNTITHRWCSRSGSDLRWNKNLYVHLYQLRWHYGRLDLYLHHSGSDLYTACTRCFECGLYHDAVMPTPPAVTDNCGNVITPSAGVAGVDPTCAGTKPIRSPIPIAMALR
jgi:hypothetical protein